MNLHELGFSTRLEALCDELNLKEFNIGRVIAEHKERYIVATEQVETYAEITGNLRFSAKSREEFPAVGDWVALIAYDEGLSIIQSILPRFSVIARQAVGRQGEAQIIAANIDFAFIVQAVDRDYSINRLERYLTICNASKVAPIIVLTKTDLIDQGKLEEIKESVRKRIKDVPILAISNENKSGYDDLKDLLKPGKTYCMLGSSGVGKSTLVNNLSGKEAMKTGEISQSTNRGKHVTSHRELVVLEGGGILIDNPGMREVGIADQSIGLETTFDHIARLSRNCKFKDCTHTSETGCLVIEAVESGELDAGTYVNYLKMEREKERFESTAAEKCRKDKDFGKMVKNVKKDIKRYKSNQ